MKDMVRNVEMFCFFLCVCAHFMTHIIIISDKESFRNRTAGQDLSRGHYIPDTKRPKEIFTS